MNDWKKPASKERIERTLKALNANGIEASLADNAAQAVRQVLSLIPKGSEVFTQVSITLESIGLAKSINESGSYVSVRNALTAMNPATQAAKCASWEQPRISP